MGFNRRIDHAQVPDGKSGPRFGDKFFKGIGIITQPFAKTAIQAGFAPGPVS